MTLKQESRRRRKSHAPNLIAGIIARKTLNRGAQREAIAGQNGKGGTGGKGGKGGKGNDTLRSGTGNDRLSA